MQSSFHIIPPKSSLKPPTYSKLRKFWLQKLSLCNHAYTSSRSWQPYKSFVVHHRKRGYCVSRLLHLYQCDKGQHDTYLYAHSGNGMIAHINGIMTEYVGLDQIREKVKAAIKTETLTLQSVTVRCCNRSATFFIDPALADIKPFYYLNCFGVPEYISLSRITTERSRQTALYTYPPLAQCSTAATMSIFPFGNPTTQSSKSEIVSLCNTIFTEDDAT